MKTLVIETSAEIGSLAVIEDGKLLAERAFSGGRGHAGQLFPFLAEILQEVGEIDEAVVGVGPGGYSGLGVGVSAALGLKIGRAIPAHGISSLLGFPATDYQVVMDARGAWIFAAILGEELFEPPVLLNDTDLIARLDPQSPIYARTSIPGGFSTISASPEARILGKRHSAGTHLPLAPLYLKPPHITAAKSPFRWPQTG